MPQRGRPRWVTAAYISNAFIPHRLLCKLVLCAFLHLAAACDAGVASRMELRPFGSDGPRGSGEAFVTTTVSNDFEMTQT
jgi:hypothetical protein